MELANAFYFHRATYVPRSKIKRTRYSFFLLSFSLVSRVPFLASSPLLSCRPRLAVLCFVGTRIAYQPSLRANIFTRGRKRRILRRVIKNFRKILDKCFYYVGIKGISNFPSWYKNAFHSWSSLAFRKIETSRKTIERWKKRGFLLFGIGCEPISRN